MGRWVGFLTLLLGLGMTAYYSGREGEVRKGITPVEGEVRSMEGGGPIPTPRP
jgi:hypothetical protein